MIRLWTAALVRHRPGALLAAAAGIAVAVALIGSLAAFLTQSQATMTGRAVRGVAIDWQVQLQRGGDPAAAQALVAAEPGVTASAEVGFADSPGLTSTTGGSTQTTGAAVVLGIPADYRAMFPTELRTLAGADTGVLVAQQTAANLHVAPGDTVSVQRAGLSPVSLVVAGVVELPGADSLFHPVGNAAGSIPTAPPDNVLVLPATQWHQVFDPLTADAAGSVSTQIHVALDHQLPADPAAAYTQIVAAAHHLEATAAGTLIVGNNLGAALDAARADAAYAQVLFGFLGLPGVVLATLLTATIVNAGADRRRGEQALLRARGATPRQLLQLAATEAATTGIVGVVVGLGAAALTGRLAFGEARFGANAPATIGWVAVAAGVGLAIAAGTILLPARRDLTHQTVAAGRGVVMTHRYPAWARYGLDVILLVLAAAVWRTTTGAGYQLVLAPEGTPTIAVSYWALIGPALLWVGAGLLCWRLADGLLHRGKPLLRRLFRPFIGTLAGPVVAGMSRQRRPLVRAGVLLGLALAFAVSTATFNATYAQQAEADALLTNGADVTITTAPGSAAMTAPSAQIAATPGVTAVEPLLHRYAYIGTDLQDLYGVRPTTVGQVAALQDSYFTGGTAKELLSTLAARPDSILVAAETVLDYQLTLGDQLNLRLTDAVTHQQITVAFHYAGVVTEFPTAPKDSFFVADATYVAQQTHDDTAGTYLVSTTGTDPAGVATTLRNTLGPAVTVTDITTTRAAIGSTLTAVDLSGLTRVELAFALVLAAAAGGLVLGLGLAERRRTFAIVTALGAGPRHMRGMVVGDAVVVGAVGLITGAGIGAAVSLLLVSVLKGVFDPPPSIIAVPWAYLIVVAASAMPGLAVVTTAAGKSRRTPAVALLREL